MVNEDFRTIIEVSIFFVGLWLVWVAGNSKQRKELISDLQARVELLESERTELKAENSVLRGEFKDELIAAIRTA